MPGLANCSVSFYGLCAVLASDQNCSLEFNLTLCLELCDVLKRGGGDGVHFTEAEMRTNRLVCKPNFGNIKAVTQNL